MQAYTMSALASPSVYRAANAVVALAAIGFLMSIIIKAPF